MPTQSQTLPTNPPTQPQSGSGGAMADLAAARELFWHNVVREMLTSLSVMTLQRAQGDEDTGSMFDGRMAIITTTGRRIPIAAVTPLLACGFPGSDAEKSLSIALECTVFQIHTPAGEVYTLPLHEIRAVHSLSDELVRRMRLSAQSRSGNSAEQEPFGFAAFTSLAKARRHFDEAPVPPSITGPGLPG